MSLPPAAADVRASALGQRFGFPNNYTLSKNLAEQLVAHHQREGLPVCIVRPSLVCACLYEPVPGHVVSALWLCWTLEFLSQEPCNALQEHVLWQPLGNPAVVPVCVVVPPTPLSLLTERTAWSVCVCVRQGNWAGPIGASAALALGFYHSLSCVSSQPLHVWDVMPADLVVSCILAAAAAVAAGRSGQVIAAAANAAAASTGSSSLNQPSCSSRGAGEHDLLILQSSSSSTYPMTLMEGWNAALEFLQVHKPKMRLSLGLPGAMTPAFRPDPAVVKWHRRWIAFKVWLACGLLRWAVQQLLCRCCFTACKRVPQALRPCLQHGGGCAGQQAAGADPCACCGALTLQAVRAEGSCCTAQERF